MASVVSESFEYTENHDEFQDLEVSQPNQGLLMSLLDETQIDEYCDDERLTKVIQSLEAEIDNIGHDRSTDCQSWNDEFNSPEWSTRTTHVLDHHHNNYSVDIEIETAPCSPGAGGMENWRFGSNNIEQGNNNIVVGVSTVLDQFGHSRWTADENRIHDHFLSSVVIDQTSSFL